MWCRRKVGRSSHEIGRAFGKDHVSIQFMLSQHGGIVPAPRRRSLLTQVPLRKPLQLDLTLSRSACNVYFQNRPKILRISGGSLFAPALPIARSRSRAPVCPA